MLYTLYFLVTSHPILRVPSLLVCGFLLGPDARPGRLRGRRRTRAGGTHGGASARLHRSALHRSARLHQG